MKHLLLTVFLALSCLAGASDGDQAMIIDVRTLEEWNRPRRISKMGDEKFPEKRKTNAVQKGHKYPPKKLGSLNKTVLYSFNKYV